MLKYLSAVLLLQLSTFSCAPMKAKSLRESRNLTVGLPAVSYRPTGMFDVGASLSSMQGVKKVERTDADKSNIKELDERDVKTKISAPPTVFARLYPWDTSAFYIGVGYTHGQKSKSTFDVLNEGASTLAEESREVSYEATYNTIRFPIGWAWIWENGFSIGLDLGFAKSNRVSESISAKDNATYDATDAGWIARQIDEDNSRTQIFSGGTTMIGYSF